MPLVRMKGVLALNQSFCHDSDRINDRTARTSKGVTGVMRLFCPWVRAMDIKPAAKPRKRLPASP